VSGDGLETKARREDVKRESAGSRFSA
jgi:hypothetical protein